MSLVPSTSIPAGWYPDPQGSFQQRWWNGTSWTNEFAQYRPTLNYVPAAVQLAVEQATPAQLEAAAQVAAAQSAHAAARAAESSAATALFAAQYGALQPSTAPAAASQAASSQAALSQAASSQVAASQSASVQTLDRIPEVPAHAPQHTAPESPRTFADTPVANQEVPTHRREVLPPQAPAQTELRAGVPQFDSVVAPSAPVQPSSGPFGLTPTGSDAARPSASFASLVPSSATPFTATGAVNRSVQDSYQPFGMIPEVRTGVREKAATRYTTAAFLTALFPILPVAAAIAMGAFLPEFYTVFALGGIVVLLLGGLVLLATADRRRLLDAGHLSAAWPILAVLPPLYFIVRTVAVSRETGRASPLTLILSIVVILGIAAALVIEPALVELITPTS